MPNRIIYPVHIEIPCLPDGQQLRDGGEILSAIGIHGDIQFLHRVPVDHVSSIPVGILLCKAAYGGIIVSGSQIIEACGGIIVFSAVAEGVGIILVRVLLVAEGIIFVGLGDCTVAIGDTGTSGARGISSGPSLLREFIFTRVSLFAAGSKCDTECVRVCSSWTPFGTRDIFVREKRNCCFSARKIN